MLPEFQSGASLYRFTVHSPQACTVPQLILLELVQICSSLPSSISFCAAEREPQCSNDSFNSPTANVFGDVHSLLTQWTGQQPPSASSSSAPPLPPAALDAIKNLDVHSAVVVGHSAGGRVALDMVTGGCCQQAC